MLPACSTHSPSPTPISAMSYTTTPWDHLGGATSSRNLFFPLSWYVTLLLLHVSGTKTSCHGRVSKYHSSVRDVTAAVTLTTAEWSRGELGRCVCGGVCVCEVGGWGGGGVDMIWGAACSAVYISWPHASGECMSTNTCEST